jgi:hypothetical protein
MMMCNDNDDDDDDDDDDNIHDKVVTLLFFFPFYSYMYLSNRIYSITTTNSINPLRFNIFLGHQTTSSSRRACATVEP